VVEEIDTTDVVITSRAFTGLPPVALRHSYNETASIDLAEPQIGKPAVTASGDRGS
jgi:hypothetical protein